MKGILKYNLPEEDSEFKRAIHSDNLCAFIWDFEQKLRSKWKYPTKDMTDKQWEVIEKIWNMWHDTKAEEIPNFNELWN